MSHPDIERLVEELKAWCKAKRGRNVEIAKMLNVSPQLVSDWFSRKADPITEHFLRLRDFLQEQKPKRRRKRQAEKRAKKSSEDIMDLGFPKEEEPTGLTDAELAAWRHGLSI